MRQYCDHNDDIYILRLKSYVCDVCGKELIRGDDVVINEDVIHIHHLCGSNSIFGDGSKIEIDICQHCLKKIIKEFHITNYLQL